ncbi:30S ribosomal protein S16 [Termitomyces sp. T112]|nr:30S ribosomal protein S16 [Termitomyces sp. T112]
MPIRLRFSLHGHCKNRILHLVAVDQRARRDAMPTELLGIYHRYPTGEPSQKTIEWSVDRIRYWLSVGAIPTKAVSKLLEAGNILKPTSPYHSSASRPTAESELTSTSQHALSTVPVVNSRQRSDVPPPSPRSNLKRLA